MKTTKNKFRIKLIIIVIIIGLCPISVFCHDEISISGYITESETGEVISQANIILGKNGTLSNNYGFYNLRVNQGKQMLKVSCVGYSTWEQEIDLISDTIISIELKQGIDLQEVVLLANTPKNLDSKGLGNLRVNISQLNTMPLFLGEKDIIKAMQFLPGISSGMEGSSQLNIRGGTNDQTLYLMDDVPVYNQNHTFGFFSIFNPDALLSADMYKGGIPTIYGDRLSGVASISLKEGNDKEHHQSISLGLLAGTLSLEGPIKKNKASYLFSVRKSFIDLIYNGILELNESGGTGGSMISFYDINGKISWKLSPKTKLSWQVYNGADDLYGINKDYNSQEDIKYKEKYGFGWNTLTSSLRLTSSIRPDMFFSGSVYYSQLNNLSYYKNELESGKLTDKLENKTISGLQEMGVRLAIEQKTSENNKIFYGLNSSGQLYKPNFMYKKNNGKKINYETEKLRLYSASLFIHDEFRWNNWMFNAGVRASMYNNDTQTIFAFEPRIKLNVFVGNENKLMAAYDFMHQPINSINEMNYNVQNDFWIPFRENTLPVSQQVSLGWKNYSIPNLNFSVEGYWKRMDNLLLIKNLESYLDFHSDYSVGEGKSFGIELLAEYSKDKFTGWLSYTLSKSERRFDGKTYPFKYDSPNDISLFGSYVVRQKEKIKCTLSANMQFKSGYPYYVPELCYPSMGLTNSQSGFPFFNTTQVDYIPQYPNMRLSNYFRTDINFTIEKKLKKGSSKWQFSLLNATGHQNPYAVYKTEKGNYKAFLLIPFLPSFSFTRSF